MDELRWILLFIGAVFVGGIYFYGRPGRKKRERIRRQTPVLFDAEVDEGAKPRPPLNIDDPEPEEPDEPEAASVNRDPDSIVALYLRPRTEIGREAVFKAARDTGLEFGELQVFHRLHETEDGKFAVYSLANLAEPGGFGKDASETIKVPGLCLFMTLPNPLAALDAWDAMLATARRLGDLLGCEIQDEARSTLTRQRAASVREEMREYDRKRSLFS